jgi:uncharacterized protein (TIGR02001 family)
MMKSKLLNTMILAALAVPGVAMAADAPPVTGNVALVTDYLYRGISQSAGKPAIQGGFDYAHPSGFYIGAWGSNVSWVGATSASLELDTYLGFRNSFAGDFSYDVGFLRYNYPGYYASGATKADTNEIYGLIGWKWVTLKYSYGLGDTFGVPADNSSYVDLSASYTLEGSGVILGAHYGKQTINAKDTASFVTSAPFSKDGANYSDYNLSIAKDFSGYVFKLLYSDTNADDSVYYVSQADGSTTNTGKSAVVFSVSHSM